MAEYHRRRQDLECRDAALAAQERQLQAQSHQHTKLAGIVGSVEDFCERVRSGLANATFEQRRKLVELLIDRVIVTDEEVEIRYVIPTNSGSEQIRFCHLRSDYLAYSPLGRGFLSGAWKSFEDLPEGDTRSGRFPRFERENFEKNLELVERVRKIAAEKDVTPGQLALSWLLHRGEDIVPIPGTKRRKYLEENAAARIEYCPSWTISR